MVDMCRGPLSVIYKSENLEWDRDNWYQRERIIKPIIQQKQVDKQQHHLFSLEHVVRHMWHLFLRSVATPAWVPRGRDHLRPGPHCFLAYRT